MAGQASRLQRRVAAAQLHVGLAFEGLRQQRTGGEAVVQGVFMVGSFGWWAVRCRWLYCRPRTPVQSFGELKPT